jgi:hypothetical protein
VKRLEISHVATMTLALQEEINRSEEARRAISSAIVAVGGCAAHVHQPRKQGWRADHPKTKFLKQTITQAPVRLLARQASSPKVASLR